MKMTTNSESPSGDAELRLHDDFFHRALQVAFVQVDRGEVSELDMYAVLAEAHRRYAERRRPSIDQSTRH